MACARPCVPITVVDARIAMNLLHRMHLGNHKFRPQA